MGFVAITHAENGALSEKAGREGFRQNQAYRDFRAVLMNFFQRLAFEFFRQTSPQGEAYWTKKGTLTAEAALLAKQRKKADNRRKEFGDLLKVFFDKYETNAFEQAAEEIHSFVAARLDNLMGIDDIGDVATVARDLEFEQQDRLRKLSNEITITKPRGLALKGKLEKDWAAYERMSNDVRSKVLEPLKEALAGLTSQVLGKRLDASQRREAALEVVTAERDRVVREISDLRQSAYSATEEMRATLKDVVQDEFAHFRKSLETYLADFVRNTAKDPNTLENARSVFETEVAKIAEREASLLEAVQRQMTELSEAIKDRETIGDHTGALEQREQRLEEQLEFYSDFAQMGMAVGILQHEFERTAKNIRTAMRDIKPYADGTPSLKKIYKRLNNSFDHLDDYLSAIDPLGRRGVRRRIEVSGDEVRNHLIRIFGPRLDEQGIQLEGTDAFFARTVHIRSAALLGAFVNVVDNAIYWVANGAKDKKQINLDVDDEGFLISNSGPGIEERMRERIFDFGETTKAGGRGMGLAISRDTLQREGFDLELIQAGEQNMPIFRIRTIKDDNSNE